MVATRFFQLLLIAAWLVMMVVSVNAVRSLGLAAGGSTFFDDFAHPWRAQYNTGFAFHLLLAAAWMAYRTRPLALGLLSAVCAVMLGGAFTLAYLAVVSLRAKGDVRKVLLGTRAGGG